MIRYSVTLDDLNSLIDAEKPGWRDRASARTQAFVAAQKYNESAGIWSEIKAVYMRLQHDKCLYCERQLSGASYGSIEHDLEHFRPKSRVRKWPPSSSSLSISFPTGAASTKGYYWLAYHPMNYGTACKTCNSPLKSDYFPVARTRGSVAEDPTALLTSEAPFLIYPLGDTDEDPEQLLTFDGVRPVPVKKTGPRHRRAKVTIAFFALDIREELLRERSEQLVALHNALVLINVGTPAQRAIAEQDVSRLQTPKSRHSSCVKAACRLYQEDTASAEAIFQAVREYLDSL
jgi:hypothetical protein